MRERGLSSAEVRASRERYGDNRLTERGGETFWQKLRGNFNDPMIKILCVALAINITFALTGQTEWYESVGIAAAVLLATFVSTFSEYRNENAFQKLQEEAGKIFCKVYRNGNLCELPIGEIVVGDRVLLQAGDRIPADGLLRSGGFKADQSALNGESAEAEKSPAPRGASFDEGRGMDFLAPYKVFRGAVVVSGSGVMEVAAVGDRSVYGQIAGELQQSGERESPLAMKLQGLANGISKFGYIGGVLIAAAFLFQRIVIANGFDPARILLYCQNLPGLLSDFVEGVMLAVIVIVMAVPEGLPLMVALVSALNMRKMLKDNVLVRKIAGIETAGSLNILFSDKTGTITRGELQAVCFVDGACGDYRSFDQVPGELAQLLSLGVRQNTDALVTSDRGKLTVLGGNATERAILSFAAQSKRGGAQSVTKVAAIPFSSDRKFSAATVRGERNLTLIKGAPEKLLSRCDGYYGGDGERRPLTPAARRELDRRIDELAGRAIRVLALCTSEGEIRGERLPEGAYTLIGVIGIRDEVRPESKEAIREVQRAGVQVVMITGDRKDTAVAIAKEAGILRSERELVLTSEELAAMDDRELQRKLPQIRVVARALPSDKSRLVRAAQALDLVAGMTGDGVNDSPALKCADVGFAMGGGTEVAKEAGDIVILDDNFASIAKAILYGRTIYNSIRKFIVFQLTINVSAVLISFMAPLLGMANPLSIVQILWVNLVMDTLAALAFGGEPALRRYMQERPKQRRESIVSREMWSAIVVDGLWAFGMSLFFLLSPAVEKFFRPAAGDAYLMTGYFAFYILMAVCNAFNARTDRRNLFDNIEKNHGFWKILLLIVLVQCLMTYFGGEILRCYGLLLGEWGVVLALAFTIIPVDLVRKTVLARK